MGAPEIIASVSVAIAGLVWLIRLEGRVNVNEALQKELKDDIAYIRARIDRAVNGHG